jgi:hypothetical protein
MKIVLVSVGVLQYYLEENVRNLVAFGNRPQDIVILTERRFFDALHSMFQDDPELRGRIQLIDVAADLSPDEFEFHRRSNLNRLFRNGFFHHCSHRLFHVHSYMKTYGITDVFHLENDVMCYENLAEDILPAIRTIDPDQSKEQVFLTFDAPKRVIAGIMFISSHTVLGKLLSTFHPMRNDMENLGAMNSDCPLIQPFPIFPYPRYPGRPCAHGRIESTPIFLPAHAEYSQEDQYFRNFPHFGDRIFDAAAIGQYLGGIDPRNKHGDTRGFINETCVINYSKVSFFWRRHERYPHLYRPCMMYEDGKYISIVNLHIHCKQLHKFRGDRDVAAHHLENRYIHFLDDDEGGGGDEGGDDDDGDDAEKPTWQDCDCGVKIR